jgi:hypothetical protein
MERRGACGVAAVWVPAVWVPAVWVPAVCVPPACAWRGVPVRALVPTPAPQHRGIIDNDNVIVIDIDNAARRTLGVPIREPPDRPEGQT